MGELCHDRRLERVDHAELENPHPAVGEGGPGDSHVRECLAHIEVGGSGTDDTQRGGPIADDRVELVGDSVAPGQLQSLDHL
ncbi:MAG TPA: hypothetical protein DIW80_02010 [Gordonia polyisoprenivorans]|nr:hypothetical protein [Gordonia polyisoprenivorans]